MAETLWTDAVWEGWQGGLLIGIVMLLSYWVTGKALGASRSYCALVRPFSRLSFFRDQASDFNWARIWFIVGIPLGSALALLFSSEGRWEAGASMGEYYDSMLPSTPWLKGAVLFAGGLMLGVGARMAGGCTSGNVIVGVSHLRPSSLVAAALFFAGGLVTVQFLYRLFV